MWCIIYGNRKKKKKKQMGKVFTIDDKIKCKDNFEWDSKSNYITRENNVLDKIRIVLNRNKIHNKNMS